MVRFKRTLATAVGIGGILALSVGTGTLHAQALTSVATTTTLSSSNNPSPSGGPVTLTASVVPASGSTMPPGNVQFMDGTTPMGATVPVTAATTTPNGTAANIANFTKTAPASGRHNLTATYTPTGTAFSGSSGLLGQDVMGTNASFVDTAYNRMLGHFADTAGANYWIDQLTNQGVSRATLAMVLASSQEYRGMVIKGNGQSGADFYDLYLHRPFDQAGTDYWVGRMAGAGGLTFEQVRLNFVGSPEFFSSTKVGNNDKATTIELLYKDLLGRPSEPDGKTYWMAHYDPALISSQFLFSLEGRAFLVNAVYQQILVRQAEKLGLDYWTNLLLSGSSDENIIGMILSSDEYFQKN